MDDFEFQSFTFSAIKRFSSLLFQVLGLPHAEREKMQTVSK
jgi:hypothetical protein